MLPKKTPLLQCYLSRLIAWFAVFCNIQSQFSTCKAKGLIMWLPDEALRSRHCVLLLTCVRQVTFCKVLQASLSFVHRDIDKSDKDMRWPEQRPDKVSAQFTWRDKERLWKCEWGRSSYLQSAKRTWNILKISWNLAEIFVSIYSIYKPQPTFD